MNTKKIEWSGKTSSYHHKWHNTPNPEDTKAGVRKVFYLDAQWSTCPIEVEDQVKALWRWKELGNDRYMIHCTIEDLEEWVAEGYDGKIDAITQYLHEQGVGDSDEVIIHWWW